MEAMLKTENERRVLLISTSEIEEVNELHELRRLFLSKGFDGSECISTGHNEIKLRFDS